MRLSLDTNVLVYAIDLADLDKRRRARELIRRAALHDLVLTQQVLGEYLNVGLKRRPAEHQKLRASADRLLSMFAVLQTAPPLLLSALALAVRYKLQFWDAVIIAVCLAHGVTHLFSEDLQDGQVIDGLMIVDPFNSGNKSALDALFSSEG